MARATYGSIITDIKGSINGHTFQHNATGKIIRNRPNHKPRFTAKLMEEQRIFNLLVQFWKSLTLTQQAEWRDFGLASPHVNKYNEIKVLTGYNKFISSNRNRLLTSQSVLLNAPVYAAASDMSDYTIYLHHDSFSLSFVDLIVCTDESLVLFTTPPVTSGSYFLRNKYVLTTVVNSGNLTSLNFYDDYFAAHGIPIGFFPDPITFNIATMCYRVKKSNGVYSIAKFSVSSESGSIPFAPSDLPNLQLWLKSSLGITKDVDDKVSQWDDLSGNGNHALQAVTADSPLFVDSVLNDLPVIRFDGSNEFMKSYIIPNITTDSLTVFIVMKEISGASGDGSFSLYRSNLNDYNTANAIIVYLHSGASNAAAYRNGILCLFGAVSAAYKNFACSLDGSYIKTYIDGVLKNTEVSTGSFNVNRSILGARAVSGDTQVPSEFLNCDIAEIIVYSSSLSDIDRSKVDSYLQSTYELNI